MAKGEVQSVFPEKTALTVKRSEVTRNGSHADPALYIKQSDGGGVLKLTPEVESQ